MDNIINEFRELLETLGSPIAADNWDNAAGALGKFNLLLAAMRLLIAKSDPDSGKLWKGNKLELVDEGDGEFLITLSRPGEEGSGTKADLMRFRHGGIVERYSIKGYKGTDDIILLGDGCLKTERCEINGVH